MASFVFETGNQTQASGLISGDTLVFQTDTPTQLTVTQGSAQFGVDTITLNDGTQNLTFSQSALAGATKSFFNAGNGVLAIGTSGADTTALNVANTVSGDSAIYGFGGNDTFTVQGSGNNLIHGGADNDNITYSGTGLTSIYGDAGTDTIDASTATKALFLNGGADADTITGGTGNDHIYGNVAGSQQGDADGIDNINGGAGSDYINGNAGADIINGGTGSDRILGGNGGDSIVGGDGNDTVNGNLGDDSIAGNANDDYLRGGQGADTIDGGAGNDIIKGDLGTDTITGGGGYDVLEGGGDADRFVFSATDAGDASHFALTNGAYSTGATTVSDVITDFTHGTDKIDLAFTGTIAVAYQADGSSYSTMAAAQAAAAGILAGTTNTVAAINVGSDTYLFFDGDGSSGTLDSVVKLLGVNASVTTLTGSDFV